MKSEIATSHEKFDGWRMVLLACLSVNVGVGFTYAVYSTFMPAIIEEFSVSRSLASAGLSLMSVVLGLSGYLMSHAVRRWSIRAVIGFGFLLMACGWMLIGLAGSIWQYILAFGILCGAAGSCLIAVPPMTLINNWFIAKRGQAAGLSVVTILSMFLPPLIAAGIADHGWHAMAWLLAISALVLAPLSQFIVDRPEQIGQLPLGAIDQKKEDPKSDEVVDVFSNSPPPELNLTRIPIFWLIAVSSGIYGATAIAFAGHLVPFALSIGFAFKTAALLPAIQGATGLGGSLVGGILSDRIGSARTFALLSLAQAIMLPILLHTGNFALLALCVAVIGLCANATLPVVATLFASIFGRKNFTKVMGIYVLVIIPFNFALPVLTGFLFDIYGNYSVSYYMNFAMLVSIGVVFGTTIYRNEMTHRINNPTSLHANN